MEQQKTGTYRVDRALEILEEFFKERGYRGYSVDEDFRTTTLLEFRFFKMFFWGLDHWQVSEEYDWQLRSVTSTVGPKLRQIAEEFQVHTEFVGFQGFHELEKRIKPFKRLAKEICILSLGGEMRCKPCHQDLELFLEYGRETSSFIEFVLDNFQALNSKYHLIAPAKQQIYIIAGKLKVFMKFANPVSHSIIRVKNLAELISQTRNWANHLSCLACLYWIDHGMDETLASTMGTMLSDLTQKTMPYTPGIIASYFEATLIPQLLAWYFDFLLEELVMPSTKDDIETLREGLIFLLSFMMNPPEEDSEDRELIFGNIYSIINELPSHIWSIHSNEMKDRISETKLSDFLQKIAGVEVEVRKLYAMTPRSTQFNSPRTNAIGFLDSLLQKLKKWLEGEVNFVAVAKHGIQTVWEELAPLWPLMQHLVELQIEHEELKDLWTRIVNLVYHSAYVTSLCAAKSFFIWYGVICLPSVIEEIKVIKNEVREINDPQMCKTKMLESRNTMLPRTTTSTVEGASIGFKEDTKSIIDHLIRGRKDLTIISISGMPGQGKTTLAKRIYDDRAIESHFQKTLWCYVSKECQIRDLMIYIVRDFMKNDVEDISKLEIEDLAKILRKRLKGKRYLIVMDDIWDVGVWCKVQSSFPDDRIGSRILFTSRNHNLVFADERNFISYPLRLFSEVESWDLMKEKVSHYNGLGPEFEVIGKEIAKSCNGLPLAVALVASLLGHTKQKLELWNEVAENLKSHLASEGCMHILELSYKYLPEHLKSCFLYFGAFRRGANIRAKRLKLLWSAEEFVKANETRCSEDLAEECLDYLVSQSLVVVTERSSMGGIKTCNVHDLLYDLCLQKNAEDNFLRLVDRNIILDECRSSFPKYGHHRLCIHGKDPLIEERPICRRTELPTSPVHSLLWLDHFYGVSFDFLKSFKVLTVLDLEEVEMEGDVFPEVILCNIHLKYLALLGSFVDIPPSIAELWNIETLILKGVGFGNRSIPDAMWTMKSLRHVRIDRGCLTLEDVEENESYLAAQHNIEMLCGVIIGDDPRTLEFLRRMTRLRKLKCHLNSRKLNPTWLSNFVSLKNLEELKIKRYFGPIKSVGGTWSISFPQNKNVRKLSLEGLRLSSWGAMSRIGKHLPNLEVLKLLDISCEWNRRWDLEDGEFSKLRYLKLSDLRDLEEINVSDCESPFPCLEIIVVEYCPRLKGIPCSFGDIVCLNTIKIRGCSPEVSKSVLKILQQQQREFRNYSFQLFVKDVTRRSSIVNSVIMERPETGIYPTCVDPALEILEHFFEERGYRGYSVDDDFRTTTLLEFRFFKMFFWGFDHWQVSEEYDWQLRSVTSTVGPKLRQIAEEFQVHTEFVGFQGLNELQKRIKPFKRRAKEICILSLGGEMRCKPCHQDLELFLEYGRETSSFIEFVLDNLQALNSQYHLIAAAKQQIDFIAGKLKVFMKFANPVSHSIIRVKNLAELISQTRNWANHLSCLACLYWIDHGMDETLASTMGTMLSDLMQKTMPYTPGIIASYFEATLIPQLLAQYFDFLLEELVMPSTKDDIETLREGLIFLLSFMMNPPEEDSEDRELIFRHIYSIINELPSPIWSIHSNEMKDWISENKLSDFVQKIAGVEVEVRKLYAMTPRSTKFNSPSTNAMGFLDSLLQKLKKWLEGEVNFVAVGIQGIQTVWQELGSLRPLMQHLAELQIEREELKDLWTRIVNLVYHSAYVTSFCAAKSFFIWYGIICLPSVIEEIKVFKNEVRDINGSQICKSQMLESRNTMLPRTTTSKVEGAFIGFKKDTKSIIDHLIGGRKDLTIISISGMPGQGKTTLAKRIYNDPEIQYHFHKTLWCYVSKECKIRDLMIYIVGLVIKNDVEDICKLDINENDVEDISKLEFNDLSQRLWRSLKGNKYLVVMDDIWDVEVWCQLQSSFPDDRNGSRILFTSRNHNLKSPAQKNFVYYPLSLFSEEESWDLIKKKVSHYNGLGPEFEVIGKEIAKSCNGLPLAVALVGSLLGQTEQKLALWNEVAENLKSLLASEGCMHIIGLSYKYLPEHLKSCFLYFGAFRRGENIRAKRLKLLWIAEGFIKVNKTRFSEDLAEECLDYLISQSLVVVAERSSMGGIKTCNVHDLLYDLCLQKNAEDNFLHLVDKNIILDECRSSFPKYGHHRLCICGRNPLIEARPICRRMELPTSPVHSLLWLDSVYYGVSFEFLKSFKVLTVLDLEEVKMEGDVFPEVILCNIHLTYLALRGGFKDIPPSIAELWNLETLILRRKLSGVHTFNRRIPYGMWKMKSLRHVRIDGGCLSLQEFEGNESYLAAQHNIETLCGVIIGDDPRTLEFLGRMTRLRKLKLWLKGDELNPTCFSSYIGSLKGLEELKNIRFSAFIRSVFEIRSISSFPQNKNVTKLRLGGLRVSSWGVMSTIGKYLPNLEVLKLFRVHCVGNRSWDLEDGEFSKLRYLKLGYLFDLEEINVCDCESLFPSLEILVVEYCKKLEEIPCSFGDIGCLNTIKMKKCSPKASESVIQILQQQRDFGNHILQVFVTDIRG